jgi:hypothetical protein
MLSESLFHQQFALGIGSKLKKNIFLVTKSFMGCRRGLPQNDRHQPIGISKGGMTVNDVAVSFGVHHVQPQRFRTTGAVKDRPRSDRPKRLTSREERYIRVRISAQTVRNRLKTCRFKSRRPHKGMELTIHHKRQRHAWAK